MTDIAQASLLGLPTELRQSILEHVLQVSDSTSHVYCCHRHMGDCGTMDAVYIDEAAKDLVYFAQDCRADLIAAMEACRQLYFDGQQVVAASLSFNFCVGARGDWFSHYPEIRSKLRHACRFASVAYEESASLQNLLVLSKTIRTAHIFIEISSPTSGCVDEQLAHFETIDNFALLTRQFAKSTNLRQLTVHIRKLVRKSGSKYDWDVFRNDDTIQDYLQALEVLPDDASVNVKFESVRNRDYDQPAAVSEIDIHGKDDRYTKYVYNITRRTRSQIYSPRVDLLDQFLNVRKWLYTVFPRLNNTFACMFCDEQARVDGKGTQEYWQDRRDFCKELTRHLAQIWRAHYDGDRKTMELRKADLLKLWENWVQRQGQNLME